MASPSQPTNEQVSSLLTAMRSEDDKARSTAQQRWFEFRSKNTVAAVRAVMVQAAENPSAPERKMAAVLLRDLFDTKGDGKSVAQSLPAAGLISLQKMLLNRLSAEPDEQVAQGIKDLIGSLADILVTPDDSKSARKLDLPSRWPELLSCIAAGCSAPKPGLRARSFQVLASVADYVGEQVADRLVTATAKAIQAGVSDADVGVKVAAAVACVTLMAETSSLEAAKPMLGALPSMFLVLREAIARDEEAGKGVMRALVNLATEKSSVFAPPAFEPAVRAALAIAGNQSLEPSTRMAAIQLPVQLCRCADHMVRKAPAASRTAILQCAASMAAEVDDEEDWGKQTDIESNYLLENDPGEVQTAGLDAVQGVALTLRGRVLLPSVVQITNRLMQSGNWRERYAGLAVLAMSSDGCAGQLIGNPSKALAPFVKLAQSDPHPRVRYVAFHGIAAMIDALSSDEVKSAVPFHQQVYKSLYPFLCEAVASKANREIPRLHGAAIYALRQWVMKKVKEHQVSPPARSIGPLVDVLRSSPRLKSKQFALEAISLMITNALSKATTTSLYPRLMPVLRTCLGEARKAGGGEGGESIVDKVMQVIGTLISNVSEEVAGKDAAQVMKLIEPSLGRRSCPPETYAMAHMTAVRIAICVGEKFKPFLPRIIPDLLAAATQTIDMVIFSSPELAVAKHPEGQEGPYTRVIEVPVSEAEGGAASGGGGGKPRTERMLQAIVPGSSRAIAYSKDATDEKEAAVQTLFMYSSNLVESMFPFAAKVAEAAAEVLKHKAGPMLRQVAASTLVKCAYIVAKDPRGPSHSLPLFVRMVQSLLAATDSEKDVEVQSTLVESLAGMCRLCWRLKPEGGGPPPLHVPEGALDRVFTTLGTLFQASNERREALTLYLRDNPEEVDPEMMEHLETQAKAEDDVIQAVTEVTEALLKVHGTKGLGAIRAHLLPQLPSLLSKSDMPDVQTVGIGIIDTLFEHAAPASFDLLPKVLEDFKRFSSHAHADLRQCAAFGLGMVAEKGPPAADALMPAVVASLRAGLALKCARADENQSRSTDNVVSSLLRVARFRSKAPGVDPTRLVRECVLPNLPATDCPTESKIMHAWLLRAIDSKDGGLLAAAGGGAQGAARLLQLVAMILGEHHAGVLLSDVEIEGGEEDTENHVDEVDLPGVVFPADLPLAKKCADALLAGLPKEAVSAVMARVPPPVQELLKDPTTVRDPEALIGAIHGEV